MNSTKRVAFKFGIIYGLTAIIFFLLQESFGFGLPETFIGAIFSFVVTLAVGFGIMYFALKEQRDVEQGGGLTIGEAVKLATVTALISAIIYTIFNLFYLKFVNPDFLTESSLRSLEMMEKWGLNLPEETYEQIEEGNQQQSPFSLAFGILFVEVLGKLFYGLILGAFMKKDKPVKVKDEENYFG